MLNIVSILVFMERPLQHSTGLIYQVDFGGFQSLFLWIDLFNWPENQTGEAYNEVSILVFMERPLQPRLPWARASERLCFNPCFYGTTSSTLVVTVFATLRDLFQSLFLWNDLFNFRDCQGLPVSLFCFNPCFYGTTSSTMSFCIV